MKKKTSKRITLSASIPFLSPKPRPLPQIILPEPPHVKEYQKEMEKIANGMAVLFEQKITASRLVKWLSTVILNSNPGDDLVQQFGFYILPGLIDAKTSEDRINFLKKKLPASFFLYEFANRSLFQFGEDFLKSHKGIGYSVEEIEEFMAVYLPLLAICEMFEDYEFHNDEMKKELKKVA